MAPTAPHTARTQAPHAAAVHRPPLLRAAMSPLGRRVLRSLSPPGIWPGRCAVVQRPLQRIVDAGKRLAEPARELARRHPGIARGAAIGYSVGRVIETVPGVPSLPGINRFVGGPTALGCAVVGAVAGHVFEQAVAEVRKEMTPALVAVRNPGQPRIFLPLPSGNVVA